MKGIRSISAMIALLFLVLCAFPTDSRATATTYKMKDYCVVPSFLNLSIPPNLLLMFDNSASMYDLKYSTPAAGVCSSNSANLCDAASDCAAGDTCKTGFCSNASTTRCSASTDCGGSACYFGVCSQDSTIKCATNAACGTGNTCNDVVGTCSNNNATKCLNSSDCGGTPNTCNTAFCYDNSFSNSRTYYGYFTPTSIYSSAGVSYAQDTTAGNNIFSSFAVSSWAATPTYKAQAGGSSGAIYFEAVLDSVTAPTSVTFYATGNFLNWLTASKLDLQKMIMTGGKYVSSVCSTSKKPCDAATAATDCPSDTCVSATSSFLQEESRGCVGSHFVKEIPGGDWTTRPTVSGTALSLTFGVRGDISSDIRLPSTGGLTRIDIFQGNYNGSGGFDNATCQNAINAWTSGNGAGQNSSSSDTTNCLNVGGATSTARSTWNHGLQSCWTCAHSPCQASDFGNGDLRIEGDCENLTQAQMQALTPSDPQYACLRDTTANIYVGTCVTSFGTGRTNGNGNNNRYSWDDSCVFQQLANYCGGLQVGEVVDPSSGPQATGTAGNIPAALIDGAVMNQLGDPIRTYHGQIVKSTPPTALLQKYQGTIRLGAMAFDNFGSKSECSGSNPKIKYTCSDPTNQDGAKIISFIGNSGYCSATRSTRCTADVNCPAGETCNMAGDHSVGLINAVDRIKATTWTPFAEAYYNAIGYFVNGVDSSLGYTLGTSPTPISSYIPGSDSFTPGKCVIQTGTSCTQTSDCANATYPNDQCALNPIKYTCQSNNTMLITDGSSTTDIAYPMFNKVNDSSGLFKDTRTSTYSDATGTGALSVAASSPNPAYNPLVCGNYSGSPYLHDLAYFAKNRNIFKPSQDCTPSSTSTCAASQTINSYVVYSGNNATAGLTGICDPQTQMQATATAGGTDLYQASDYPALYDAIDLALQKIRGGEASSTAASILSNSSGSGANILQAVFFPKKIFGNDTNGKATKATWIGEMLNLWYYIDPFINLSTIREDNTYVAGSTTHSLDLKNNNVLLFNFDSTPSDAYYNQTVVQRYQDAQGDGNFLSNPVGSPVLPDSISAIWRAGGNMLAMSAGSRHLYTPFLDSGTVLNNASSSADSKLMTFATTNDTALQTDLQASSVGEADNIISWVQGADYVCSTDRLPCNIASRMTCPSPQTCDSLGYRNRTVNYMVCSASRTACTTSANCPSGETCGIVGTWKLGDIISSTPKVQSTVELNTYDMPPSAGYSDISYGKFIGSSNYLHRGMAYVGANDGMLHAFKMGTLDVTPSGTHKASLLGNNLGQEQWAFIPTNVLPYLRYLTCVSGGGDVTYCGNSDYGHLYYVDGATTLGDYSIGKWSDASCGAGTNYWQCARDTTNGANWRSVLIGGMGTAGASKDNTDACVDGASGTCVKSPIAGVGNSSYFALDVTNQYFDTSGTLNSAGSPPQFMWEFSDAVLPAADKGLGFATTGAALVRINSRDGSNGLTGNVVKNTNGRWFAVFGSGPTGPIDKTSNQFLGTSNQDLKIYVVDLNATPPFVNGTNYWVLSNVITASVPGGGALHNSFVSSMSNATIDTERWNSVSGGNYQDNALYFGYTSSNGASPAAWTGGGLLRLITNEDPDPAHWQLSQVAQLNEPVTTGIARLQDRKNHHLWLYFGTGRYFYNKDDMAGTRHLYALKEPCYTTGDTINPACTTAASTSNMVDQSSAAYTAAGTDGWYITLDAQASPDGAERAITDPVAMTNGTVFFSTFKPTSDVCAMGGNSYLWAVKYDTGLLPVGAALKGQVMFQLSTGQFKQVNIAAPSTFTDRNYRRTGNVMTGKPPNDPPPVISNSNNKPVKRIIHIQERQ